MAEKNLSVMEKTKEGELEERTNMPAFPAAWMPRTDIRETEKEEKGKTWLRREASYGSFLRSFELPEGLHTEDVKATCKDGVLTLTMRSPRVKSHGVASSTSRGVSMAGGRPPAFSCPSGVELTLRRFISDRRTNHRPRALSEAARRRRKPVITRGDK